jgi:trans-aconitate 2-methyltransferase
MLDHTTEPALALMRDVAARGPWAERLAGEAAARDDLPTIAQYYDLLRPHSSRLDIWHTVYNHVMDGPQGVVEWFKGSALRPFLSPLDDAQGLSRGLHGADRQGLPRPFRRQGAVALSAPVHRGGEISLARRRAAEAWSSERP